MKVLAILAAAATLIVLPTITAAQGGSAWTHKEEGYYFKLGTSYLFTREEFNYLGDRQEIFVEDPAKIDNWFRNFSITAYVEYGLSDKLTLVGQVPFGVVTSRETEVVGPGFPSRRLTRTNGGLGDLWLGARSAVLERPLAIATQLSVKIPLGYEQDPDNFGPPLGTGEFDTDIGVFLGTSFHPLPAYAMAGTSVRRRGGELHDEWRYGGELGYTGDPIFLKVRYDGLQNIGVDPPDLVGMTVSTPNPGGGGVTQDIVAGDQDEFKVSGEFNYKFRPTFAVAAEIFHTFAGKNTIAGTTVQIGVVYTR